MLARKLTMVAAVAASLALAAPAMADAAARQGKKESNAPKRVVALTPFAANAMASVGRRPIAVGQTVGGDDRFAPSLSSVPVLPLAHPNGPNLEQLASLRPDLVLSNATWRAGHPGIQALGIQVREQEPTTVNAIPKQIRSIGRMMGRKKRAIAVSKKLSGKIAKARTGISRTPRVMLILGVGRTPYTFLANSFGGDLIDKAGGELITGGYSSAGGFARISDEVVVANNPEIIIAVPHANPEDVPELEAYLRSNPAWQSTDAAKNGRVYVSTDNSLLQGNTDVAALIRQVRSEYLQN